MHLKPDPRFLAITAHDLRGAVGVLDGAMKELTRDVSNDRPDAAKLSLMMTRSTQRLLLIADRLSVLAKLTDNEELELSERGDVSPLVKEAVNVTRWRLFFCVELMLVVSRNCARNVLKRIGA